MEAIEKVVKLVKFSEDAAVQVRYVETMEGDNAAEIMVTTDESTEYISITDGEELTAGEAWKAAGTAHKQLSKVLKKFDHVFLEKDIAACQER